MKAVAHTQSMLRWWAGAGIDRADLAVRRANGGWLWHYAIPLDALPLPWARAENTHEADVYIRPAREHPWPLVFLDDVPVLTAARVASKYDALVVRTSQEGGCHLWLSCSSELDQEARKQAQRWLTQRIEADHGSTSGEHLGRLAGFKNWKRGGSWVNVLHASRRNRSWTPKTEENVHLRSPSSQTPGSSILRTIDTSESGREWGRVCGMLEAGYDADTVYRLLVQSAWPRRGHDAERYARRTVNRAIGHVRSRI